MVGRRFVVHHKGTEFPVNYDTENCFEVLKFQIFSLTQFHPTSKSLPRGKGILSSRKNLIWWVSRKGSAWRQLKMEQRRKWNRYNNWGNPMRYWLECCRREFRYFISLAVLFSLTISCLFNLAEEEALFFQQFQASEEAKEFEQRVRPYINRVMLYGDPVRQEAARETVPISEIQEKSLVSLAKEGNFKPSKDEEDHNFLLQLLIWFKQSFSWVNSPPCDDCGRATSNIGMGAPLSLQTKFGASRVELYRMPANV